MSGLITRLVPLAISSFYKNIQRKDSFDDLVLVGSSKLVLLHAACVVLSSPAAGVQSIVSRSISVFVAVFVCVHLHKIKSKTRYPNFTKIFASPYAVASSSFGDTAVCYVLLVLWMTSFFTLWGTDR